MPEAYCPTGYIFPAYSGAMFRVCQLYFSTQTAMTAHIALTPLKSAAVRHGINAIVADIYNVAAAYDNSLADTQKFFSGKVDRTLCTGTNSANSAPSVR